MIPYVKDRMNDNYAIIGADIRKLRPLVMNISSDEENTCSQCAGLLKYLPGSKDCVMKMLWMPTLWTY